MRFQSRAHLSRHFGLQDRFSNYYQPDFEWCKHALKLGYDSILVGSENSSTWRPQSRLGELPEHSQAELVICSGQCNVLRACDACPPVEMRTGIAAQLPCACDPRTPILNCGTLQEAVCIPGAFQFTWRKGYEYGVARAARAMANSTNSTHSQ
jgi:hypothetical protein